MRWHGGLPRSRSLSLVLLVAWYLQLMSCTVLTTIRHDLAVQPRFTQLFKVILVPNILVEQLGPEVLVYTNGALLALHGWLWGTKVACAAGLAWPGNDLLWGVAMKVYPFLVYVASVEQSALTVRVGGSRDQLLAVCNLLASLLTGLLYLGYNQLTRLAEEDRLARRATIASILATVTIGLVQFT